MHYRLLILGLLGGMWAGQWGMEGGMVWLLVVAAGIVYGSIQARWSLVLLSLMIGYGFTHLHTPKPSPLIPFAYQKVTLQGWVCGFPRQKIKHQNVPFCLTHLTHQNQTRPLLDHPKILLQSKNAIVWHYGDGATLKGTLKRPPVYPGFDYRAFLATRDIHYLLPHPEILHHQKHSPHANPFQQTASDLRTHLEHNLQAHLPPPHRDIAMGILLGTQRDLPKKLDESFRQSGLTHILVVSGSNVAIIVLLFHTLFRRLGPYLNALLTSLGIGFFVLMAGGDPPVVRAGIMGTLAGLGMTQGRTMDGVNALLLTALLMNLFDPRLIQGDASFYLSFSATSGILLLTPKIMPYLCKIMPQPFLQKILGMTLGAQIGVFPCLWYFFGEVPLAGLLTNLFVEPFVLSIMIGGAILALLGWLPKVILLPVIWGTWTVVEGLIKVAEIFGI